MIPKKIHFCWFGGNPMGTLYKECIATWKEKMPDFEIIEWNESNIDKNIPFVRYCLENKKWAFLSDYIRMYALNEQGGIYLDVDMEVVKSLDPLLNHPFFIGYEDEGRIGAGAIGGVPGHHFFKNAMQLIEERHQKKKPYLIAPEVANACIAKEDTDTVILPWPLFYPYNPYAKVHDRKQLLYRHVTDETYLIHHWGKGWKMSLPEKILRKLSKMMS
ncbi:glycosyltransferase family 32 protein [Vreelandella alkaliphila]|uniref:Glycosyltransferase n=1 Tax=Vreelandella alkaliphila TaxID=272774 RepID=A0ABX4HDR8_9GAMM|nr:MULTISPECIES: glycosyltransferase [Halomonas]PAU70556.1 hypothetical protein CK497_17460 [Halomonas humidisoli]